MWHAVGALVFFLVVVAVVAVGQSGRGFDRWL